jgi:hypothetical protein
MPHRERLPVVDGEINGDVYGHATTARGAKSVATRTFVDVISHVYLQEQPFKLRTGETIEKAWVAVTKPCMEGR